MTGFDCATDCLVQCPAFVVSPMQVLVGSDLLQSRNRRVQLHDFGKVILFL